MLCVKRKNLIFLGAPGSGKGTQANFLSDKFGYEHISTGDLLRAEIVSGSVLGSRVKRVMDSGDLVTDELVIELLRGNLDLESCYYIFDGFPRNLKQVQTLDKEILDGRDYLVIYFKVDTEKLVNRIVNRRVSEDGKHIYNLLTNPPKVEGLCDVTGSNLVHRKDDTEEVVRNRMSVFIKEIEPMLEFYSTKGNLLEINADLGIEEVSKLVSGQL